jgi:hypothetical protein
VPGRAPEVEEVMSLFSRMLAGGAMTIRGAGVER